MRKMLLLLSLAGVFVQSNGQESFNELQRKGNKAVEANNYEQAVNYFRAALDKDTSDMAQVVWVSTVAAASAEQLGNQKDALDFYLIAIKKGASDAVIFDTALTLAKDLKDTETEELLLLKGRDAIDGYYKKYTTKLLYLYYNKKKFDKMIGVAEEILALQPEDKKVLSMLAVAYMSIGNTDNAEKTFLSILKNDSLDLVSNRQLGLIYYNRGQQMYNNANKEYEALTSPTRVDYADYLKQKKKVYPIYDKAAVYLERSYRIKPDKSVKEVLYNLYIRTENKPKASEFR